MYDAMRISQDPRIAKLPSVEERNAFFDKLPEKEIRRRQDINQGQIAVAKLEDLELLRIIEEDLMQAMLRRC